MIETKLFEIRDRATCISAMATRMLAAEGYLGPVSSRQASEGESVKAERFVLHRVGFLPSRPAMVILMRLTDPMVPRLQPHEWTSPSDQMTMGTAHQYILENWDKLLSGDVIDSEFLRGETAAPKTSDRLTAVTDARMA